MCWRIASCRRASFDGKHPMRIAKGYSVHFETSLCPLPLINIGSLDVVSSRRTQWAGHAAWLPVCYAAKAAAAPNMMEC